MSAPPRSAASFTTRASSRLRIGGVDAVAVGGLDQQHVRLRHQLGVAQDRAVPAAEVAREEPASCGAASRRAPRPWPTRGCVPRGGAAPQPGLHLEALAVGPHLELLQRRRGIVTGVERLRGPVLRVAVAVGAGRVLLLQVRGVGQQDAQQVRGAGGAEDRPAESLAHQQRQRPGVVDVRVAQHYRVDRRGLEGRPGPVAQAQGLEPLEQAAVEQDPTHRGASPDPTSARSEKPAPASAAPRNASRIIGVRGRSPARRRRAPMGLNRRGPSACRGPAAGPS